MKGISYTLEAVIAGLIVLTGVALFSTTIEVGDVSLDTAKLDVQRCLVEMDNENMLRSHIGDANGTSAVNDNLSDCLQTPISHETSFCADACNSSGTAPDNVTRGIVNYYVVGYTDLNPVRVSVVLW